MRYLDGALSSRQNNFDLIRLLAAALVIYGHTFTFVANSGARDIIRVLTGFDSGDLAVKSFFFLSGLLVTNSIIEGKSLKKYVVSRLFRIMPALLFMLLIVTFCIGTALTTLPLGDYLVHSDTYRFFVKMSLFGGWGAVGGGYHQLPGVFEASPASGSVNVPLWTLTVEVFSYALILALFALGLLQKRVTLVLALVIIGDSMLGKPVLFYFLPDTLDHRFTPFCFALGGLCAVYKQEVSVSFLMPFGFGLLYVLFRGRCGMTMSSMRPCSRPSWRSPAPRRWSSSRAIFPTACICGAGHCSNWCCSCGRAFRLLCTCCCPWCQPR